MKWNVWEFPVLSPVSMSCQVYLILYKQVLSSVGPQLTGGQNIMLAWQAFGCPLATLQLCTDAGDDERDLADRPRQTGITCGITLSQPAALTHRKRETGEAWNSDRIKRDVVESQWELNRQLITSQQERWLHGNALLLFRAGLLCLHMLSYGQLLTVCHCGLVGIKTSRIWWDAWCFQQSTAANL